MPKNNPFEKKHHDVLTEKTIPQTTFNNKKDGANKFKKINNSNEGSYIDKKREYNFNNKSKLPQKLVDLQVYQQNSSSGSKYRPKPDISVYGPINTGGFNPPYTFGNYGGMPYPLIKPYNPNIVKKYVIDNSMLGSKDIDTLFENVVPTEMLDFRKISQRLAFAHFIKSNLIKENGDYIKLHGTGNTLLSHVKPIDINPQYYGDIKNDNNMVLFQSCYPIQLDKKYNNIECSSKSAGINLRVYDYQTNDKRLDEKERNLKKELDKIDGNYHEMLKKINEIKNDTKGNNNVDNEIFINEYIKDNILKKIYVLIFVCIMVIILLKEISEIQIILINIHLIKILFLQKGLITILKIGQNLNLLMMV